MNNLIYAIGDIHGRDDLLCQLHEYISDFHRLQYAKLPAEVVHIGDYIDGGANSVAVIDRLMRGIDGMGCTCLMGNHEAMMLECMASDNRQAWYTWLSNGGEETLASLGVSLRFGGYDPLALCEALGPERVSWLRSLPLSYVSDPYLFVHAGIVPGVPLDEQQAKDVLWIRSRFLESDVDHGCIVVHGHTPGDEPIVKENRICVDTGATSNGLLTAAVLDGKNPPFFLRASGRPGKGN
jgi:serine/threonine protein phosphatase 1